MQQIVRKDPTQLNNDAPVSQQKQLQKARQRVFARAALAVMTVLLTVVIVFGMTAAWYTNVVQTGGLIFQVEELGVNVNATIGASNFTAKPGDSGVISLTAQNNGTGMVNITVSTNKTTLDEQMQKRLYFYVEAQQSVNGETAQRTYLTDGNSYTYTVFAGDSLALTDVYHNDAQLKWYWVYDVLGYYVLGTKENDSVTVREYLRPIEYNYDNATFDSNGNLLTVDGVISKEKFLTQLSATDGFEQDIDVRNPVGGYYPVAVDASGYGVYVYLCNRTEVEENTDYDTQLGLAASKGEAQSYTIQMTVNAEPVEQRAIAVSNGQQLKELLVSGEYNTIRLASQGIELDEAVTIPAGRKVILDLNGQTLTTSSAGTAFALESGASLTMLNGTLKGTGSNIALESQGADVAISDVTVKGYNYGIYAADYKSNGQDSVMRITDSSISAETCAVLVYGNGSHSEQKTTVIIERCTLDSNNITVSGNGTSTGDRPKQGTDIQIINSRVYSVEDVTSAAIFHPQKDSTLNIYKSEIRGYTGIALKGGSVTIAESTVTGVGENPAKPAFTPGGFTNTGAAVSVETDYDYEISLTVDAASALESYHADAVTIYKEDSPYLTVDIRTSNIKNRTVRVEVSDATTLVEQLAEGNNVKLTGDITLSDAVTVAADQDFWLDLNGNKLTTEGDQAFTVEEGGSLTMVNGSMAGSGKAFVVQGGELTLEGVNMSNYGTGVRIADDVATGTDSVIRISNCTIDNTDYGVHIMGNGDESAEKTTLIIEDSKLYGNVYALTGNGNTTQAGTDIQIIRSTLSAASDTPSAAIYHPQDNSTLTIRDSQLSGYTGIAIKGGTVIIEKTNITGTGANPMEPGHAVSGFTDTAAAISIETSYNQPISVTVDAASTLESYYADAVVIFEDDSQYVTANIQAEKLDKTKETE